MDLAVVAWTALVLAILSFFVFVILSIIEFILKFQKQSVVPPAAAAAFANAPAIDPSKILEAAAKLAEAMAKAGPALSALIASLVFLSIAGVCAGVKPVVDKATSAASSGTTGAGSAGQSGKPGTPGG